MLWCFSLTHCDHCSIFWLADKVLQQNSNSKVDTHAARFTAMDCLSGRRVAVNVVIEAVIVVVVGLVIVCSVGSGPLPLYRVESGQIMDSRLTQLRIRRYPNSLGC